MIKYSNDFSGNSSGRCRHNRNELEKETIKSALNDSDEVSDKDLGGGDKTIHPALPNPMKIGMDSIVKDLSAGNIQNYINKYKECKFWLGSWDSTPEKSNWRKKTNNGLCEVNSNIKLFAEMDNVEISYANTFADGSDIVPKPVGSAMNVLTDVLDSLSVLAPGKVPSISKVSPFDNPKTWEKTSPIKFGGDLTFNFKFGQAGLYSGLEEVIKPMYAIGALFAPGSPSGAWTPPLPTKAQWAAMFLSSAFTTIADSVLSQDANSTNTEGNSSSGSESGKEDKKSLKDMLNPALELQQTYFNAIHNGAVAMATQGGYGAGQNKLMYIQIGHFRLGPCTVGSVKMTFDQNNLDDNGYPTSGKLSLGNIETYLTAVRQSVYGTIFSGYNDELLDGTPGNYSINHSNLNGSSGTALTGGAI